jgi:hypothetical protein
MRIVLVLLVLSLSLASASVEAQDVPEKCYPVAVPGRVLVTTNEGATSRATLLCIASDRVMLASEGRVNAVPLDHVEEIAKPADGIADGFLKGVAVAGIFSLLCFECGDAGQRLSVAAIYGGIGAAIDALNGSRETIYRRSEGSRAAAPTLTWRLRF